MTVIIYGAIILAATFFGAFVGLGGGVIIKPLLDLIGRNSVEAVNFISTCAVFCMSISSAAKHIKSKTPIKFGFIATVSSGSVLGGILGSVVFDKLTALTSNGLLKSVQGIILGTLLVAAVIYINIKNAKSFKISNPFGIVLAGIALGFTAAFLGVGGGPINVAFLVLFFSLNMKEASVYSIGIIFFSQLSKLITMSISSSIPKVSAATIAAAVACAVIGGILGSAANKKGSECAIRTVFTIIVSLIALVNFINGFSYFI